MPKEPAEKCLLWRMAVLPAHEKIKMYLHLGKNMVVRKSRVVAVCDLDNTTGSRITRDYLAGAEKSGSVVNVADDLPKSFVIYEENGKITVYLSQLSPATLLRRSRTRLGE